MELRVTNPFDASVVAEVPYDAADQIESKICRAAATQARWRDAPLEIRQARVRAALERFRKAGEQVARDVSLQMGKPLAQSHGELRTFFDRAERALEEAPSALAPDVVEETNEFSKQIRHEPLGLVFNLAAWNYPLLIPVNVIVPALLAGNAVLLKHSAKTPLTGQALAAAFDDEEFPGLVTDLTLRRSDVATVIADPRVQFAAFTGSVEGGRSIHQAAAERLLDVGLELGGNDAAYVAADADLDYSVANIVDGACYNAGQSCCAIERIYVHRDRYDEFLERALPLVVAYQLGDPMSEETTMGPLASAQAPAQLQEQVDEATSKGARLLGGARLPDRAGDYFYAPVLLADVPQDCLVMQEESFGPLVPVAPVNDDQEAVAKMNDSRFGLTASIWTADDERAEAMARQVAAGTIFQNRADYVDPALPWTGWHESGFGSTLSRYGFHQVTRRKAIHFRRPR